MLDKGWIDTPEITDAYYLKLLGLEGFLRRLVDTKAPFILKGSLLTRQYISKKEERIPADLDFLYGKHLTDKKKPEKIFNQWITEITETELDDDIIFKSFILQSSLG